MSCKIVLKDFNGSYYPGNTISGYVVCVFDSSKTFRAIRVRLRGKEHNSWWETESYYDPSSKTTKHRSVQYTGNNRILSFNTTLVGEGSLSAGRYVYPFTFTLPRDLPGTYQGSYGFIRYYIKANVDIPYAFDYEYKETFKLISLINFNNIKHQLQLNPVYYEDEKSLCCCCRTSDLITMKVHLQKEAFVLGEMAKIKVDVTNMSNTSSEGLEIQVNMIIESKVTSPRTEYKEEKKRVTFTSDTGVGAHGQRIYEFDLEIPKTTILPNFTRSALFMRWCEIKVKALIPGCHSNLSIKAPIVLGHIPIGGTSNSQFPQGAPMTSITNTSGGVLPSCPPPYSPVEKPGLPYALGPSSAKKMPVPVHGLHAPEPSASAPPDQLAPSAPPKKASRM